jgi:hypothetical protein
MPSYSFVASTTGQKKMKYVASRRFMQHITSPPSILQGNTCIMVDGYDREEGKGAGPGPAPLICYTVIRGQGCVGDTHIGAASSVEADLHSQSSTRPPTSRYTYPSSLLVEAYSNTLSSPFGTA